MTDLKIEGPSKLQDMKLQNIKMMDQIARHKNAGHEIAVHEFAGHKNARHEIAVHENVRLELQDKKIEKLLAETTLQCRFFCYF